MFRLSTLAPLLLCLMASLTTVKAGADLCGAPGRLPPMDRFDCLIVASPPISCGQLFFQMAAMQPNSYTRAIIDTYGGRCCGYGPKQCLGHPGGNQGGNQGGGNQQPQNQPQNVGRPSGYGGRGPNNTCNICRNGGDLEDTFNPRGQRLHYNLRYIGRPNAGFSCAQFSWLGKNGYIPNFMCGPVMSILPRYCPVCTGGQQWRGEEPQQSSPAVSSNTASSGSQCSRYNNNKNACKDAGCKYKKNSGRCIEDR